MSLAHPEPPSSGLVDQFGKVLPPSNDPAWQPPVDVLASGDVRQRASIIYREVPISVVLTGWDVPMARAAKRDLVLGLFEQPAQMCDAMILSDSRIQSGLASRLSVFGRPVDFRLPRKYRKSALAQECLSAFVDAWPTMATDPVMSELQRWAIMLGWGLAQILWNTSGKYAIPHPLPWHPRYVYYHWLFRCYVAITLDGQVPIVPGDASWILHAPHGQYRGWMRGAMGAISPWWLGRAYALRDWMRYSERHGLPMIKLKHPAISDPYQAANVRFQVANLGQEAVFDLPQNPPPALSWDVDLLEAKDTAHEGFRLLIEQCNQEITLALLAQTLTTSMPAEGGSSYAAARVHAGVLQGLLESDARALALTIYQQLARPFAAMNFGNADLAPVVTWDVTPFEDAATKAQAFMQLAAAVSAMRTAGFEMSPRNVRRMMRATIPGFDPGMLSAVDPIPLAAVGAKAKADASAATNAKPGDKHQDKARVASLMSGIRFDPRTLDRMRVNIADESQDALRDAMAEIEAHKEAQQKRRMRWAW